MRLFIPSKTFLIGEYSVLENGVAFVAATKPCFEFPQNISSDFSPHPESPAGQALKRLAGKSEIGGIGIRGGFLDPHQGRGGFGASTAEWISVQLAGAPERDVWKLWSLYREDAVIEGTGRDSSQIPSGADVIAQLVGGIVEIDSSGRSAKKLVWPFPEAHFLIFRTGLKIQTHDHLKKLGHVPENVLSLHVEQFAKSFRSGNFEGSCKGLVDFSAELAHLGLVDSRVQLILEKLRPFTSAIKGCGAMGVDTVLCFVTSTEKRTLLKVAPECGLELVADESALCAGVL